MTICIRESSLNVSAYFCLSLKQYVRNVVETRNINFDDDIPENLIFLF
jgi:hypothetical protein